MILSGNLSPIGSSRLILALRIIPEFSIFVTDRWSLVDRRESKAGMDTAVF